MGWTLPDKGEGDNDLQSILFQEYLDVLVAGIQGLDCVISGLAVTGGSDMTPAVAAGAVLSNGQFFTVSAGDVTIGTADATNPRIDLIVVNSSGTKAVRAGTAAANPKPPARSANDVVIAAVYVPANDTSIETTKCIDMRVLRPERAFLTQGADLTDANVTLNPGSGVEYNLRVAYTADRVITLGTTGAFAGCMLGVNVYDTSGNQKLFTNGGAGGGNPADSDALSLSSTKFTAWFLYDGTNYNLACILPLT